MCLLWVALIVAPRSTERSAGARRTPRLLRCWLAGSSIWQQLLRAAARLARDRVCAMRASAAAEFNTKVELYTY